MPEQVASSAADDAQETCETAAHRHQRRAFVFLLAAGLWLILAGSGIYYWFTAPARENSAYLAAMQLHTERFSALSPELSAYNDTLDQIERHVRAVLQRPDLSANLVASLDSFQSKIKANIDSFRSSSGYLKGLASVAAPSPPVPDIAYYAAPTGALLILLVLVSLYRYHESQAARMEGLSVGFIRFKVATSVTEDPSSLCRLADYLGNDAFGMAVTDSRKRVESPIPGHPTSDLVAVLISKILDRVDDIGRAIIKREGN